MNEKRTLAEIEEEMDHYVSQANLGKVLDLIDEHGNTIDEMYYAIFNGDLDRLGHLASLGINVTDPSFVKAAVDQLQLRVLSYQAKKGADVDQMVQLAKACDREAILVCHLGVDTIL